MDVLHLGVHVVHPKLMTSIPLRGTDLISFLIEVAVGGKCDKLWGLTRRTWLQTNPVVEDGQYVHSLTEDG
ncbi:hypothetical protein LNTAR_09454 [Lentisphaera araneosa HTCC2155]|uniref:Uncharacterized protein n=1 Tax=Lentisphaera araneosa HTCC2155 TaxID=313628 RepID=A6DID2_9BACT|nr:hypothetical protein LNTAR_09454 [Lentisphaera araneosa HTCC2155]